MKLLPGMNINCKNVFKIIFKMSHDIKTMDFQYKAVYNVLATIYCQWKIKKKNLCTFCNEAVGTQLHFFWECIKIHNILIMVKSKIAQNTPANYDALLRTCKIKMCKILFVTKRLYRCKINE